MTLKSTIGFTAILFIVFASTQALAQPRWISLSIERSPGDLDGCTTGICELTGTTVLPYYYADASEKPTLLLQTAEVFYLTSISQGSAAAAASINGISVSQGDTDWNPLNRTLTYEFEVTLHSQLTDLSYGASIRFLAVFPEQDILGLSAGEGTILTDTAVDGLTETLRPNRTFTAPHIISGSPVNATYDHLWSIGLTEFSVRVDEGYLAGHIDRLAVKLDYTATSTTFRAKTLCALNADTDEYGDGIPVTCNIKYAAILANTEAIITELTATQSTLYIREFEMENERYAPLLRGMDITTATNGTVFPNLGFGCYDPGVASYPDESSQLMVSAGPNSTLTTYCRDIAVPW